MGVLLSAARRSPIMLGLVLASLVFMGAAILLFLELVERQSEIVSDVEENALWASYQLDREALKLQHTLVLLGKEPTQEHLDDARVQFDLLYSRLNILSSGQLKDIFQRLPDGMEHLRYYQTVLDTIDKRLFNKNVREYDISYITSQIRSLQKKVEQVILDVLAIRSKEKVIKRTETLKLFWHFGILLSILALTMAFIIAMLFRQVSLSDASYRKARQLAGELVEAVKEAKKAAQAKSDFLATMSHEIRTPMNAIVGMTHLVMETKLSSEQTDYMEKIQSSSGNLLHIVNDILDFSKIESGKLILEERVFNLDDVLEYVYTVNKEAAHAKGLSLTILRDFSLSESLIGDEARLQQILINLVSNAIKFTHKGYVQVCVFAPEEGHIQYDVKDTGIGIAHDVDVFDVFTQADSSTTRLYGGTGLGLSISKELIKRLNGKIWYESVVENGTTFSMQLPYRPTQIQPSPEGAPFHINVPEDDLTVINVLKRLQIPFQYEVMENVSLPQNAKLLVSSEWVGAHQGDIRVFKEKYTGQVLCYMECVNKAELNGLASIELFTPKMLNKMFSMMEETQKKEEKKTLLSRFKEASGFAGKSVLLAEDNKINAEIAKALLEKLGINVTWVENGQEAVDAIRTGRYDLILMDIRMPVMDGYQASQKIALDLGDKKPPIVALTADVLTSKREQAKPHGIDDVILKPLDPIVMLNKLEQWLLIH